MERGAANISDAELARLAELASLRLPEDPAARKQLAVQLGDILGYVAKVQEYDVAAPEPEAATHPLRADEPAPSDMGLPGADGQPAWLADAPTAEGRMVAVPALFADRSSSDGAERP